MRFKSLTTPFVVLAVVLTSSPTFAMQMRRADSRCELCAQEHAIRRAPAFAACPANAHAAAVQPNADPDDWPADMMLD